MEEKKCSELNNLKEYLKVIISFLERNNDLLEIVGGEIKIKNGKFKKNETMPKV